MEAWEWDTEVEEGAWFRPLCVRETLDGGCGFEEPDPNLLKKKVVRSRNKDSVTITKVCLPMKFIAITAEYTKS